MILIYLTCTCISLSNIASQKYVDDNIVKNKTRISSDGKYDGVDCSVSDDVVPSMKYVSVNLVDLKNFDDKVSASVSAALSEDADLSSTVEGMVEDIVKNMASVVTEAELNESIDGLSDIYVSKLDIKNENDNSADKAYSTSYTNSNFASINHAHDYIPTSKIKRDASDTDDSYQIPTLSSIDAAYMKKSSVVSYDKDNKPSNASSDVYSAQSMHVALDDIISSIPEVSNAADEVTPADGAKQVPSILKVKELIDEWFNNNYEVVDRC